MNSFMWFLKETFVSIVFLDTKKFSIKEITFVSLQSLYNVRNGIIYPSSQKAEIRIPTGATGPLTSYNISGQRLPILSLGPSPTP